MPSLERDHSSAVSGSPGSATPAARDAALAVLTGPELAGVVDLVAWTDSGRLHVANATGAARIPLGDPDAAWETTAGRNPVAHGDPLAGTPLAVTLADPSPPNERNSYPHAAARLASAFADPDRSPDLWVIHTPAHHWPERGGHLGEHGSLDAGQSRAPLILSGAGVAARGVLPRSARTLDVAPTLAAAAGVSMTGVAGRPLPEVAAGARHVVGLLWDGAHPLDLYDLAARGVLPAVARLLERGCAYGGGAIAEFPSVTLVNHTTALTGVGPGRHGIVGNVFYDRARGERVLANDSATWHRACELLRPGVATLWEALRERRPAAFLACVDEPIDRGADYSTFELIRQAGAASGARSLSDALPRAEDDPHADPGWVAADGDYRWSSQVDGLGLVQVLDLWSGAAEPPAVMWWNTTLTDTGHHGGGPFSAESRAALVDSDRRLGVFLDRLAELGRDADTFVLLTADHGMEAADPAVRGDWDAALTAAGIAFRDEGYGAVYLG